MLYIQGNLILHLRQRHNITQKQLAASLYGDIDAKRISGWENNRRGCRPLTFWAMVLIWDKVDLWDRKQEKTWKEKFYE